MTRGQRDYSSEYERRQERAHERGFDSYSQERRYRDEAREFLQPRDIELTNDNVLAEAQFRHTYSPGDMTRDALHDVFFDWFPDASDQDFYDWLDEVSGDQPS